MVELNGLYDAILNGDHKRALAVTREALAAKADPLSMVTGTMMPAMDEVGRRFQCEEFFVPELLMAARAMKASLELIRPLLAAGAVEPAGKVIVGTVKGDLHDIGKNLVISMLQGAGFEVTDLGTDVPPHKFVEAIRRTGAPIVCLSALLTVTMPAMKTTIEEMKAAGVRDRVQVIVGGAPVTAAYASQIGADEYGKTAADAVTLARRLVACAR
jgi:corrinoid protein of di/trimethylamine methyltransferase